VPAGSTLILYNDAPAPFPSGDPEVDYYPESTKIPPPQPGYGPNTRTLLQIVVGPRVGPQDDSAPLVLPAQDPAPLVPPGVTTLPPGIAVRNLTLNEDVDQYGRLIQRIGTTLPLYPGTYARNYEDAPTETPLAGTIEAWRIFNLTGDTHPIHFHLVNVQIVSRQPFNARRLRFEGNPVSPDPNEAGWKETVRMNPAECTTVIMKFDLPAVPFVVPPSPRTGGNEYVWHCHILEHEEHDMMRPLIVL
jgi:spore coat protein A